MFGLGLEDVSWLIATLAILSLFPLGMLAYIFHLLARNRADERAMREWLAVRWARATGVMPER